MNYYNHYHDPRNFANHPQFPEPKKSSSWVGWLLMIFGALIGGFFLGQNVKIEEKVLPNNPEPSTNDTPEPTNDKEHTFAVVVDEPKVEPEPPKPIIQTRFIDLDDDIIARFTADFANIGEADKLFTKREFQENSELITKYPELAKLLGFWIDDKIEDHDTDQPL